MTLFQQSTLTYTAAKLRVTGSAGTATDDDLKVLAGQAIQQAIQKWNSRKAWNHLLVTAPTFKTTGLLGEDYPLPADFSSVYSVTVGDVVQVQAPQREADWGTEAYNSYGLVGNGTLRLFNATAGQEVVLRYYRKMTMPMENAIITSCVCPLVRLTFTAAVSVQDSASLTVTSGATNCFIGEIVSHTGFASGVTIKNIISDTELELSAVATASRTFGDGIAATVGGVYVTGVFTGVNVGVAVTGTSIVTSPTTTVSKVYSLYALQISQAPSVAISAGDLTFTSASQHLDILADHERGIIALAKHYYLRDKGGDPERIAGWKQESQEAFAEAVAGDSALMDDQTGFKPGYLAPNTEPHNWNFE